MQIPPILMPLKLKKVTFAIFSREKINFNANIIYAFKITNEIGTYLFCLESDLRKQKCDLFHFSTR